MFEKCFFFSISKILFPKHIRFQNVFTFKFHFYILLYLTLTLFSFKIYETFTYLQNRMFSKNDTKASLHIAARNGDTFLISQLLSSGFDINLPLKHRDLPPGLLKMSFIDLWTPLHFATDSQKEKAVKLLIKHQANVNAEDEYGQTPLHLASAKGNVDIASFLVKNGASINGVSNFAIASIKFFPKMDS